MNKKAVIIGAGPAGLTAAYELQKQTDIQPVILEATNAIGGISQTVEHKGNRMDIGGHRFFSKNKLIMDWWMHILPMQGAPALDDKLLQNTHKQYTPNGPDPETANRTMLVRERVSRIFYLRKFFDYPISLKWQTFANMGLGRTLQAGFGYIYSALAKKDETNLENFYINRFGKPLYKMFFEDYTTKVWGKHPSVLGADWGAQRVKGLSILAVLKDMIIKTFGQKDKNKQHTETSLIEEFIYPKYGPGQLWETVAADITDHSGQIHKQQNVTGIHTNGNRIISVDAEVNGTIENYPCDYLLSSMPLKDLVAALKDTDVPTDVKRIAAELPYRDFITVGVLVKELSLSNKTKIKTYNNRIPDTWIYIQERDVKIGRLQIFNNWSPYMVADYKNTMYVGLEYFCSEGDELWQMSQADFTEMAVNELVKIGIVEKTNVLDAVQIKMKKAYPAYFGTYYELDTVRQFLDKFENLYCIGRNGQHRYNNIDHSMLTAMEAVQNIKNHNADKTNIWSVNTEEEYHESK